MTKASGVAGFTVVLAFSTIGLWLATNRLWRAGKDALETTERAFVFIDGFNVELNGIFMPDGDIPSLSYFAVQPKWSNSGNTPTKRMTIRACWHNPGRPFADDYSYRFASTPFFVSPKAVQTSEFVEMTGGQALIDRGWRPVGPEPLMLIWGRAHYEDVFGGKHFVEWCYRVRFDRHDGKTLRAQLIQWGTIQPIRLELRPKPPAVPRRAS